MKSILDHLKPNHHHHPKKPLDVVRRLRDLLIIIFSNKNTQENKVSQQLYNLVGDLQLILYGDSEILPNPKVGAQVTSEFFKDNINNPFRLLISCFSEFEWQCKKKVSQVIASLLSQQVSSHLIAAQYLEENLDLVDILIAGLFDFDDTYVALLYGVMLRECIRRSQILATHVLESDHCMNMFLEYVRFPNYTFAAHVEDTLELLLTRHRSTVAKFLSRNYDWFFKEFNNILKSPNLLTKTQGLKLLGEILFDHFNSDVMIRYVSSTENLKILMNSLRESKLAQMEAFHVFKLFVTNRNKPKGIIDILRLNKNKLLQFSDNLRPDKEDEQFGADKVQVIKEIATLKEVNCRPISTVGQLRVFQIIA